MYYEMIVGGSTRRGTTMLAVNLQEQELVEGWFENDTSMRGRFAFPMFWATGNQSSSIVYFELDAGKRIGRHTDSAEELVLILQGEVEATLGEEVGRLAVGDVALIPALAPHDVRNIGEQTARIVGFFSSNTVLSQFEQPMAPIGTQNLGTPSPEMLSELGT